MTARLAVLAALLAGLLLPRDTILPTSRAPAPLAPQAEASLADRSVRPPVRAPTRPEPRPLRFEPNVGQDDPAVQFLARGSGYAVALGPAEAVLTLPAPRWPPEAPAPWSGDADATSEGRGAASLRLQVVGATGGRADGESALPGTTNYFRGDDPARWRTDVPSYGRVRYADVLPGVDQVWYGHDGRVEFDFVVGPDADPSAIRLRLEGMEAVDLTASGDLLLRLPGGEVRQPPPRVYQERDGERVEVAARYALGPAERSAVCDAPARAAPAPLLRDCDAIEIRFEIGTYDTSIPLVIDPEILYATYLGATSFDEGHAIAADDAGNAYLTGVTDGGFPLQDPAQGAYGGGRGDAFVAKLDPDGQIAYVTYLGGSGYDDGKGIGVDALGNTYVAGITDGGFPVLNAAQPTHGGNHDAFVAKLDPRGRLVYATYLGGPGGDQGLALAADRAGYAYVTGTTTGAFPVRHAAQPDLGGGLDAFVAKLTPDGALVYATYLGGPAGDNGLGIATDNAGSAYVTGSTAGQFPVQQADQGTFGGGDLDAFVAKLDPAGALVYATYLGGPASDEAHGIAADGAGNAYVTGSTGGQLPVRHAAEETFGGGGSDAFVARLSATGAILYATYLGGTGYDQGRGIAVDRQGNAYVAGFTDGSFPVLDATQPEYGGGGFDAFVARLDPTGAPTYATYLGGADYEQALGIAADAAGTAYVVGNTAGSFPVRNAAQPEFGGGGLDAFVARLSPGGR